MAREGMTRLLALIFIFVSTASADIISCVGKVLLKSDQLSCQDKQLILDEHNNLRQKITFGKIQGMPIAANMRELIWDDELADMAQKWASKCAEIHDPFRHIRRFYVEQNILKTISSTQFNDVPNWRQTIYNWFNEAQYKSGISHYNQIFSSNSYLIGCGYTYYYDPAHGYIKNYVCNYAPGDNVNGHLPYERGQPASSNYGMTFSSRYRGLCSAGTNNYLGTRCN
ncbi:venom allergen 5-like [Apis florea]|uniref:venom allergen 5-like n=1 Tax=Apis florea TaxID=7463 RepID=UPI000629003B|nr:venom allergen 5-like [Apis florea]